MRRKSLSRKDSCFRIDSSTSREQQASCIVRESFSTRNDRRDDVLYYDRTLNSPMPSCTAAMRVGAYGEEMSDTYTYSDEDENEGEGEEEEEEDGFQTAAGHSGVSRYALQESRRIFSSNISLKHDNTSSLKFEHRVPHLPPSRFGRDESVDPDIDRGQGQGMSKYGSFSPSPFRDLNVSSIQLLHDKEKRSKSSQLDSERLQYDSSSCSKHIDAVTSAEVHELRELIRKMTERKIESIRLMQITHPHQNSSHPTIR